MAGDGAAQALAGRLTNLGSRAELNSLILCSGQNFLSCRSASPAACQRSFLVSPIFFFVAKLSGFPRFRREGLEASAPGFLQEAAPRLLPA
jgi:hypothetical protein